MEKQGKRARDIRFYSKKNKAMVSVHSYSAKRYAERLEEDDRVKSYQANIALNNWEERISPAGIRSSYRACGWTTDFLICGVRTGGRVRAGACGGIRLTFSSGHAEAGDIAPVMEKRRYSGLENRCG